MQETGNKPVLRKSISDELFQEEIPERYDLLVFAGPDEIACTVLENAGRKFVALESWQTGGILDTEVLESIRSESKLLALRGYRRIIVCSGFHNVTLIPRALYDPGTAADQLQFSNPPQVNSGQVMTDELHQLEAVNVFTTPDHIISTIGSWFPSAGFHHSSTALIEYMLTANRNSTDAIVLVNVHSTYVEIVVTKGRQLLLYNHYIYKTPEELVYYVLFVFEQLHLNPDHIPVLFAGDINEGASAYQLSYKYIRNTGMAIRPDTFTYSSEFNSLPVHYYFNLFTQVMCVS